MEIGALRAALERGEPVPDAAFDALYPAELRARSELHWTSISIALRAAALLDAPPGAQVLDVGSGAGKACLVAYLSTRVRWWGVEQDRVLVDAANHAAWQLGIRDDMRFVHADAWDLDWARFDAFYFFNPFPAPPEAPGNAFQKYGAFVRECVRAEERLARLRGGVRVVTYHGFGGDMPDELELIAREPAGTDELKLWLRR
jgi:protein-L-isoaspartate O-methyltransferase